MIYVTNRQYISEFEIPSGYKVEFIPETVAFNGKTLSFTYSVEKEENTIRVKANYSFNRNIYDADSYKALKEDFGRVISKLSDMVVLVKNGESSDK